MTFIMSTKRQTAILFKEHLKNYDFIDSKCLHRIFSLCVKAVYNDMQWIVTQIMKGNTNSETLT